MSVPSTDDSTPALTVRDSRVPPGSMLTLAAKEIWQQRELAWRLLQRDLSARYRQSLLGYFWAVIPVLATTAVFLVLRNHRVINVGETIMPYAVHILFGLLFWQFFSGAVTAMTTSLTGNSTLIAKINFPRECLLLAALGGAAFDALIRLALVIAVFAWYDFAPSWSGVVLSPLAITPFVLLTVAVGMLLAPLQALFRDTGNALPLALGGLFFTVPVVYPPPTTWPWVLINDWNPLAVFINGFHDLATYGYLNNAMPFFGMSLFAFVALLVSWRLFRVSMPIIAERL
jgi:lipopolysaccharide transport system permease protein